MASLTSRHLFLDHSYESLIEFKLLNTDYNRLKSIEPIFLLFQIILVYCLTGINSQLGPVPRFAIPAGAGQSINRQPIQYRNERLVSGPGPNGGFLRARRPIVQAPALANTLPPFANQNSLNDEAKPVTEENESVEVPTFVPQQQQPLQQFHQVHTLQQQSLPAVLYTTDENGEVLEKHRPHVNFQTTPRFIQQQPIQEIVPTTIRTTGAVQRFLLNQDRPVQSALQGTTKPPVSSHFNYFLGFFC